MQTLTVQKPVTLGISLSLATILLIISSAAFPFLAMRTFDPQRAAAVVKTNENTEGSRVTLSGKVTESINANAFVIKTNGVKDEEMVVISVKPLTTQKEKAAIKQSHAVQVDGRAQYLSLAALRDQVGSTVDMTDLKSWEGKPVVVADVILAK